MMTACFRAERSDMFWSAALGMGFRIDQDIALRAAAVM